MILRIRIEARDDGGWLVLADDGDGASTRAELSAEAVADLQIGVATAHAARPAVAIGALEHLRAKADEQVGAALASALGRAPAVSSRLGRALGASEAKEEPLLVAIEATDPDVRALPWELLAAAVGEPPLELTGRGRVVRLLPGVRPPSARRAPAVIAWSPTPDDPRCAERLAALEELARRLALPWERCAAPWQSPARPGAVLHVVCHGERLEDSVALAIDGSSRSAAGTAHSSSLLLRGAVAVVLDVCESGHPTPRELDSVAGRFLSAGAGACVAPFARLSTEAAQRFAEGFYASLVVGDPLHEAVGAGRRGVQALGRGDPESRWTNFGLLVSSVGAATAAWTHGAGWHPEGWPAPAPGAAAHLAAARELAESLASGFVGVEHLVLALGHAGLEDPFLDRLAALLFASHATLRRRLGSLRPGASVSSAPRLTPRLVRLSRGLPDGFSLSDLWRALAADPGHSLHELAGMPLDPGGGTVVGSETAAGAPGEEAPGAGGLEVSGGPEDGRRLEPAPGDVLGRASRTSRAQHALYAETRLTDPTLKRHHLTWRGDGRIELARAAMLLRAGWEIDVPAGDFIVRVGDLLELTEGTRLRGIG